MCKYCGNNTDDIPCDAFEDKARSLTSSFIITKEKKDG